MNPPTAVEVARNKHAETFSRLLKRCNFTHTEIVHALFDNGYTISLRTFAKVLRGKCPWPRGLEDALLEIFGITYAQAEAELSKQKDLFTTPEDAAIREIVSLARNNNRLDGLLKNLITTGLSNGALSKGQAEELAVALFSQIVSSTPLNHRATLIEKKRSACTEPHYTPFSKR